MSLAQGAEIDRIAPFGNVITRAGAEVKIPLGFTAPGATNFRAPGFIIPPLDTPEVRAIAAACAPCLLPLHAQVRDGRRPDRVGRLTFCRLPRPHSQSRERYLQMARESAATIFAQKAKNKSEVPLREKGLQVINRYNTEYIDMVDYGNDITARARMQKMSVKEIFRGPTAQPTSVLGNKPWIERTLKTHASYRALSAPPPGQQSPQASLRAVSAR